MILKSSKPLEAKLCERKWGISLYALCSLQWGDTLFEDESESESEWMELIFLSVLKKCMQMRLQNYFFTIVFY